MSNKNRYHRRNISDMEIDMLVLKHKTLEKYTSLFSDKIFDSENKWKNDVIRNLDTQSCNKFFWSIEPIQNLCKCCGKILGVDEYSYGARSLGFKGFQTYCIKCQGQSKWISLRDNTTISKKISKTLTKWAKTVDGKLFFSKKGKHNSKKLKLYFQTEGGRKQIDRVAKYQSILMKEKIKRGEFTPHISNSWTHWDAKVKIDGKVRKFRSSWEACFAVCNPHLKYEVIRIPYQNNTRIYIGDFYDDVNRVLYEIKPISTYNIQINKLTDAIQYCLDNKIKFIWINENNILQYVNILKFDQFNILQYNKMMKGLCVN